MFQSLRKSCFSEQMKCNKYILWPLSVNRHGGDVMSRTALCAFWGTYGCMTAIAAEVTYTWKLQNLWCWSKREKKKQRLHLAQSERKALQPCCFATKASSRRRSACGGLQTNPFLPFSGSKGIFFRWVVACLGSVPSKHLSISINRCASTLSETFVDGKKRGVSLATSSTEVKLLEVSKRPAHARASTSQSFVC